MKAPVPRELCSSRYSNPGNNRGVGGNFFVLALFVFVEILLILGMVDMLQLLSILWCCICERESTAHPRASSALKEVGERQDKMH